MRCILQIYTGRKCNLNFRDNCHNKRKIKRINKDAAVAEGAERRSTGQGGGRETASMATAFGAVDGGTLWRHSDEISQE